MDLNYNMIYFGVVDVVCPSDVADESMMMRFWVSKTENKKRKKKQKKSKSQIFFSNCSKRLAILTHPVHPDRSWPFRMGHDRKKKFFFPNTFNFKKYKIIFRVFFCLEKENFVHIKFWLSKNEKSDFWIFFEFQTWVWWNDF